jgi:hypothetical protein
MAGSTTEATEAKRVTVVLGNAIPGDDLLQKFWTDTAGSGDGDFGRTPIASAVCQTPKRPINGWEGQSHTLNNTIPTDTGACCITTLNGHGRDTPGPLIADTFGGTTHVLCASPTGRLTGMSTGTASKTGLYDYE